MESNRFSGLLPFAACIALVLATGAAHAATQVTPVHTPHGGIQPQVAVDEKGAIHVVYLKGDPKASDVFYVRKDGDKPFTMPLRVNSKPGSAIAGGTIRGAQLALGRNGRVHVAWNDSGKDAPRAPQGYALCPLNYSRLDPASAGGAAFEPQRDLMGNTSVLDGGATIAADKQGRVFVLWHAADKGAVPGEANRAVFAAVSADDGKTFATEKRASASDGVCACCGMKAFADSKGNLYALYRAAKGAMDRDMILLFSRDGGKNFSSTALHPWRIGQCPMSSESLFETQSGVLASWETAGHIHFAEVNPATGKPAGPVSPPFGARAKHPSIVANAKGERLLVWAEGTGWQKGGSLAWQLLDAAGKPLGEPGRVENGVATWSFAVAVARLDGSFVILH